MREFTIQKNDAGQRLGERGEGMLGAQQRPMGGEYAHSELCRGPAPRQQRIPGQFPRRQRHSQQQEERREEGQAQNGQ